MSDVITVRNTHLPVANHARGFLSIFRYHTVLMVWVLEVSNNFHCRVNSYNIGILVYNINCYHLNIELLPSFRTLKRRVK